MHSGIDQFSLTTINGGGTSLGEAGGDGRRECAAGAVGVGGVDEGCAVHALLVGMVAVESIHSHVAGVAHRVAALDDDSGGAAVEHGFGGAALARLIGDFHAGEELGLRHIRRDERGRRKEAVADGGRD